MKSFVLGILVLIFCATSALGASGGKNNKEFGLGMGGVGPYPMTTFPRRLMAVLEGSYLWKNFSLSILATATSSQAIQGTYWFGNQMGGYQQTFIEPRVMLSILHLGVAVGLNLSEGSSGTIQSMASYGAMAGIRIPLGRVSLGLDARYILNSTGTNPDPVSAIFMFRFKF